MSKNEGDQSPLSMYSIVRAGLQQSPIASLRRSLSEYTLVSRSKADNLIDHRHMKSEGIRSSLQLAVVDAGKNYVLHGQKSHVIQPGNAVSDLNRIAPAERRTCRI